MKHGAKIVPILLALATFSLTCCAGGQENADEQEKEQEQPARYTVTFVQNGQKNIVKEVESGATLIDIPMPVEKTGYNVSWDRTIFENITADITVNDVETAKIYTVRYDLGSLAEDKYASITSATQTVTYDAWYSLYVPECYGYDFVKWENDGAAFEQTEGIWTTDDDVLLVAVWKKDGKSERWWSPFY